MSAFRIKNIDTGIIDDWVFRINDAGIIVGDDVVAEDPNELAVAVSDTQELLVKTSIYSPGVLIHATEGALSRIKTIEDTFGTTTLQDAYDNGRFIAVAAGSPLSLGALGEFELDSSGNLRINANTFKVTNGSVDLNLSETGAISANTDLTFGSTGAFSTTLQGGVDLFLTDSFLSGPITLSETANPVLLTTAQSLVGAINEISSSFSGTDFQQIYDQSAPATITTSFAGGPIKIINGSGNPNTPALQIDGGIECIDFMDVDKLTVGPGITINATIDTDGMITTNNDITTATKLISPRLENTIAELTFVDSRGSVNLTEISDGVLTTVKQSLFGSINEVSSLSLLNAAALAVLDVEHDMVTGIHDIINTQSTIGLESTSRLNIKNGSGVTKVSMNALGEVTAEELTLGIYDVVSELAANVAHRADDGSSHSAVAAHFAASNPHSVVKSVEVFGDISINGSVVLKEGAGVTLNRVGQEITIAASAGSTLQGVYDTQVSGDLNLDTAGAKHLFFKDSGATLIMALKDTAVEINKDISLTNAGAAITASSDLTISSSTDLDITSTTGDVVLSAVSGTKTTKIQGVDFTAPGDTVIDNSVAGNAVGALNDLAENHYTIGTNGTGIALTKGTAVTMRDDGSFWTLYPDPIELNAILRTTPNADIYWHGFGVLDENVGIGATGRVRTSGIMSADVGQMDGSTGWRRNDSLFIARHGYSEVEIVDISLLADNDTVTFDTATAAKAYTAKTSGAIPASGEYNIDGSVDDDIAADKTRDNLIETLNNEIYMDSGNDFFIQAFIAGEVAKGRAQVTAVGTVGNTFVLTPVSGAPGATITLTAVANGTTPAWLEYELGITTDETAVYLAEAINRTRGFDGPDPQTAGDGHNCNASAYGSSIEVRWLGPGATGNNTNLSTTGGNVTAAASLTGGTAKIHVYRSDRSANGILCSELDATAITCADFTDDEGQSQYMNQMRWLYSDRIQKEDDRRIKIGKVISYSAPTLTFMVDVEEPRRNERIKRGDYR